MLHKWLSHPHKHLMVRHPIYCLLVVLFLLSACTSNQPNNNSEGEINSLLPVKPEIGALAPDFELPNMNGNLVKLSDFRGQPIVLTFMHSW